MRPEPLAAFHQALRLGPGYCPPDLFDGSVPAIVRGLKVHANNISHARHIALEETYPRLAREMGLEAFHAVAELFLEQEAVLGRSLDGLGKGFDELIDELTHRDLARAEWAWLQSFHAAEADALTLVELAAMTAEELHDSSFDLHPATRLIGLERPERFAWDEPLRGAGDKLLLTRPEAEVLPRRVGPVEAEIVALIANRQRAGDLLDRGPAALITLIGAGALVLEKQP